jgi:hypothetical protein
MRAPRNCFTKSFYFAATAAPKRDQIAAILEEDRMTVASARATGQDAAPAVTPGYYARASKVAWKCLGD